MSRAVGLPKRTAAEQLQRSFPRVGIQPLPAGQPGRASAASLGIAPSKPLTFYVIGDHGGVKAPGPQNAVACAMEACAADDHPAFVYSVGDIVYFNGDASEYGPQFYEPYAKLGVPIVGVPGNHDGDTSDDASRTPLDTFMANFCSPAPAVPTADPQLEYGRHTQTQPWCDWTLADAGLPVTIIGLYSNVPSGGHLEQAQIAWLANELHEAELTKPCIVALHHPPLSIDAHHGGSQHMGDALDAAIKTSNRPPDLVLSGHVHDYQRFTRQVTTNDPVTMPVRYVVVGNSGYHNLHKLATDATPGSQPGPGVRFEFGDDSHYGFLVVRAPGPAGLSLSAEYVRVSPGVMPDGSDAKWQRQADSF